MLNFCDFIRVYVFTTNHHLKHRHKYVPAGKHIPSKAYGDEMTSYRHFYVICPLGISCVTCASWHVDSS